jgi:DNA recombination-dependent growth factor C
MSNYIFKYAQLPTAEIVPANSLVSMSTSYANANVSVISTILNLVQVLDAANTQQPTNTSIQVVEQISGNLQITWMESSDYANVQISRNSATIIRSKRNALLADTDWTHMPDVNANTTILWTPYRQALRDITKQNTFPQFVTWPTKPV